MGRDADTVYMLWPALQAGSPVLSARDALPPWDVDLTPFAGVILSGKGGGSWRQWERDYATHFRALEPEFGGRSRLAHLFAASIVVIRRTKGDPDALRLFRRIATEHGAQMREELSIRWLRSVADTFADHGETPGEKAVGLLAGSVLGVLILAESERQLFAIRRPWPPKRRTGRGGELAPGLRTFHPGDGDLLRNTRARLAEGAQLDPVAGPWLGEIAARLDSFEGPHTRLRVLENLPMAPVLHGWRMAVLNWLANRWL